MVIALECVELSNGGIHILVNGKIDDVELRFVVDTGASHSVMDIQWARLNLDEDNFILENEPAHGIGSSVEVHRMNISNLKIYPITYMDGTLNQYMNINIEDSLNIVKKLKFEGIIPSHSPWCLIDSLSTS